MPSPRKSAVVARVNRRERECHLRLPLSHCPLLQERETAAVAASTIHKRERSLSVVTIEREIGRAASRGQRGGCTVALPAAVAGERNCCCRCPVQPRAQREIAVGGYNRER